MIGSALSPYLLVSHPLELVILSPSHHHVALVAPAVDPIVLFAAAVSRRLVSLLIFFALGHFYGVRFFAGALTAKTTRWERVGRIFDRWGLLLLALFPSAAMGLLAGARGLNRAPVVACATVGTCLSVAGVIYLGDIAAVWTQQLVAYIADNVAAATLIAVAIVIFASRRRLSLLSRAATHRR
ncbi:MAG: hypothetical protein AAGE52_20335 [Myxococcota bacterium]